MTDHSDRFSGSSQGQSLLAAGAPLERARAAMLMLHGRGASAHDILSLADELAQPGFAYLAPQAPDSSWYPYSFLSPIARNEPYLSSALDRVETSLSQIVAAGIPLERVILLGFSQGACLALEYVAGNAQRYGGVIALSGGLIGPDDAPRDYPGSLDGTPIFLGCSDTDPHIPKARVTLSEETLRRMCGDVTKRFYPHMGHTVNEDELAYVRMLMATLTE